MEERSPASQEETQYVFLLEALGHKLLDYMLITDEANQPTDSEGDRLQVLYEVSQKIIDFDNVHILRLWITGNNPDLGFSPPATAIRNGEFDKVYAALGSYVTGSF